MKYASLLLKTVYGIIALKEESDEVLGIIFHDLMVKDLAKTYLIMQQ